MRFYADDIVLIVLALLTQRVVQVLLPHQLQIFLDGLGGQRVLPEDQHVVVRTAVHLRHHQVRQEVLRTHRNPRKLTTLKTTIEEHAALAGGSTLLNVVKESLQSKGIQ